MKKKKIVFLYSEMAGYFIAAVKALVAQNVEVLVIHWPVKSEAPFDFSGIDDITLIDKSTRSVDELKELIHDFSPEILVTSGWMDRDYVRIAKGFYQKIPTVLALDNHWFGTLKQRILTFISPFWLKRIFSDAWVAGEPQARYAKKLGFGDKHIHRGYYTADVPFYEKQYLDNKTLKNNNYPHVFLYVGRYIRHKGIFDLWEAFIEACSKSNCDWELWCVGAGELFDDRIIHPKIKHLGFLQPNEMSKVIPQTGVLILPSHFEPWGVVVHEFAAAGYPMLLSNAIGAGTFFLNEPTNGYAFESGNVEGLKNKMLEIMTKDDLQLLEMGEESHRIALQLTPEIWANTLLGMQRQ